MTTALSLVVIMVAAGIGGGLLNCLLIQRHEGLQGRMLFAALLGGVGSALLVPLLLRGLSSPLLETLLDPSQSRWPDLLAFGGLCMGAAVASRLILAGGGSSAANPNSQKQIDDARRTAHRAMAEVDQIRGTLQTLRDRFAEREVPTVGPPLPTEPQMHLLDSIRNDQLAWRTIQGIVTASAVSGDQVIEMLEGLENRGYVARWRRANGDVWALTAKAMDALEHRSMVA
jgi:hypothetical protein